jgi:hypothetical protein
VTQPFRIAYERETVPVAGAAQFSFDAAFLPFHRMCFRKQLLI